MAISAEIAEGVVVEAVRHELADVEGRASAERDATNADIRLDQAQADLNAAIEILTELRDEPAARKKLSHLKEVRDAARKEAHRLGSLHSALTVNIAERWDDLSLAGKREAVKLTIAEARVFPGKGAGRVRVKTHGEKLTSDGVGEAL